jgi:hypothetical protein
MCLDACAVGRAKKAHHRRAPGRRTPELLIRASKAVHNQEDEEWRRRIELERLHELNREYVERLIGQIDAAGVGTLSKDERVFMERMAKINAPPRPSVRAPTDPWPSPA